MDDWSIPFSGFFLGEAKDSLDFDIEGIFRQAIMMSTGLGSQLIVEQDKSTKETEIDIKRWMADIIGQLKESHEDIASLFNYEITLKNGKIKEKIGFLSPQYGAEFSRLNLSMRSHSQSRRMAQAKLWQLDQLREINDINTPDKVELIVGYKQRSILSSEQLDTLENDLDELKLEAESRDITVFHTDNTQKVASHIYYCVSQ